MKNGRVASGSAVVTRPGMKGWLALGFHVRGGQQWWLQWNIKVHDEKPKKNTGGGALQVHLLRRLFF